ncbi:MAG: nuclear transport factor 2 family protein [Pseudomonadota bacterium]
MRIIIAVALSFALSMTTGNVLGDDMSDYDAIKETIGNYFDGFRLRDRERLEKAFAVDMAHMKGYVKGSDGSLSLTSRPMDEVINDWVNRDHGPEMKGKILSIQIFSEHAAIATFDFNGIFTDTFQLAKLAGEWRIVNKFYVDQ